MDCEARITAEPNRETRFVLDRFRVDVPEILDNAAGMQMILVDHSEYSQAVDGMSEAKIREVIDHHNLGDIYSSDHVLYRCAPVGSTCTLIYMYYKECGIDIKPDIAGLMLSAIISDTRCLSQNCLAIDRTVADELSRITGISDINEYYVMMDTAAPDYTGMSDSDIFFNDYKQYSAEEYIYGVGVVNVRGEDAMQSLFSRMCNYIDKAKTESQVDMMFLMCYDKNSDTEFIICSGDCDLQALEFADLGKIQPDGSILCDTYIGRKSDFIPVISEILTHTPKGDAA